MQRKVPLYLAIPACGTALIVAVPLIYIFIRSAEPGWETYLSRVLAQSTIELLVNTLALVAGAIICTLSIALPMAWLVTRTDLPGRRIWAVLGALPLVLPSYVAAFTLVALLRPTGYLQSWLSPLGIERLPDIAYGYSGALMALTVFSYPYTYLLLIAALRNLDPALEESSRALGASRLRTFVSAVIPQLLPSMLSGSLLVSLYVLSDFGAVSITRYNTFTYSIYFAFQGRIDRSYAASLATVLVAVTLLFLLVDALLSSRFRPAPSRPRRPPAPIPLGRWKWPSIFGLCTVLTFALFTPIGVIIYWAVRALWVGNDIGSVGTEIFSSLLVSILAGLVAALLAIPIIAWAERFRSPFARLVERGASAGFALPGLVIALSLVFFVSQYLRPIYQTLAVLVAAYVIRFLPEALAAERSALLGISTSYEEAGRSLGHSPLNVLRTLTLPLMKPGIAAAFGLVFLTSMKELPATLILRPIGFETLATRIWSGASEAIYSQAAIPSLCLVGASILPVYLLIIRPTLSEERK
ncbi:MAG: iron ABC transporter permease [Acidobacteriota bacterium]